jgi:hypothetical protein
MSLNNWLDKGWLIEHRPDRREIKKRNISDYERAGAVSEQEAREMLTLAITLRETVTTWLKKNHLNLIH